MRPILVLGAVLAATAARADAPIEIAVWVPLCDSALIDCGKGALGDPRSLSGNLYWGARYGAERHLLRAAGFRLIEWRDGDGPVLRETKLARSAGPGEREVRVTLRAWAGDRIDDALADYLAAIESGEGPDLLVWAGHDRLMDVSAPRPAKPSGTGRPSAVLACSSERHFGPALAARGSRPVALTRTFMAPEGYLLEALAASVARNGVQGRARHRTALAEAYAKYQRISLKAALTVFVALPASD